MRVVVADRVQMAEQVARKGPPVVVAHEAGETLHTSRVGRQRVGLPVCHHLQPVLDARGGSGRRPAAGRPRCGRQVPGGDQRLERAGRRGLAQGRVLPAPDQLHRLGGELDAADAALAELHVVPGDARHRVGCVAEGGGVVVVHAALHGADIGDSGEIEVAAPDERTDLARGNARPAHGLRRPGAP